MRILVIGLVLFAVAAMNVAQGGAFFIIGTLVLLVGAAMLDHRLRQARKVIAELEGELLERQRLDKLRDHARRSPEVYPGYLEYLRSLPIDSAPTRGSGQTPDS